MWREEVRTKITFLMFYARVGEKSKQCRRITMWEVEGDEKTHIRTSMWRKGGTKNMTRCHNGEVEGD